MKTLVAVGQMTSTDNKADNLDCAEAIITKAARLGARLVSLPENFAFLASVDGGAILSAETLDGLTITRLKECARKNQIWLSLGGFQEKILHQEKIYNTHVIIDDQGGLVATYRKIHCFSVSLPDGSVYDEAKSVMAGDEVITFSSPFFRGGLSICYDLRFANLFSSLRTKGAEVILVPAAFTETTGKAHWEVLLRARAIETQCYVMASAQVGRHNDKRATHGHAMIIDPWGTVIAQCGQASDVVIAEIDLGYLMRLREGMPLWSQRRLLPDEYI
jgi:deaminated glutathione amidase